MDDRIKAFLDELKAELAAFPETETREAAEYYEEYISDALEEGESVEAILSRLGSPGKIAAMIMTETSIKKAQDSPGLKNYSKVLKYSRTLITRPFSILLFSIFIFVTYSTAFLLFLGAIASAAAACAVLSGGVYEALKIPAAYTAEIIGTIGFGLFSAALCLLPAIGLFWLCRLFIRLSAGLVGLMLNKPGRELRDTGESTANRGVMGGRTGADSADPSGSAAKRVRPLNRLLRIVLAAVIGGLVLSLATGLPVKLFMIFNSMKPASVMTREWEYDKSGIRNITIRTAQSHIRLEKGNSDRIIITYEQPDWMEPEINSADGQLSFDEKSNGRLPLFPLVSMHENRTDVVLTLPQGFDPELLKLESRGGFIRIGTGEYNVEAKTYTGNIFAENIGIRIFTTTDADKSAKLKASTSTGAIQVNGSNTGIKTAGGLKYEADIKGDKSIKIETTRGSIFID